MSSLPFDLVEKISELRLIKTDTQDCEVKEAVRQLPDSLTESVSAFANSDNGGVILLGLSEKNEFKPAPGFDAQKTLNRLMAFGDQFTPVIRPTIFPVPFEGATLVAMIISPVSFKDRPCYITLKGPYSGAFIRTADGDRHLTPYEIDRMRENREQPEFDLTPVPQASMNDLQPDILNGIVSRIREITPRAFGKLPDEDILVRLGALTTVSGKPCPTLAGLLVAGVFPQQFFPRLEVTFTVYPGPTKVPPSDSGIRYLDSTHLVGSIPDILQDAFAFLRRNMRIGAQITSALRYELPDYPFTAFREALVNALQHRDYSPEGRASQVQVNLYSESLEILSPGGLYGAAQTVADKNTLTLPGVSATRNLNLSRLLEYTPFIGEDGHPGYVIENRGTGLIQIQEALKRAQMPPVSLKNYTTAFCLTMRKLTVDSNATSTRPRDKLKNTILTQLCKLPDVSISELETATSASRRTIASVLKELIDQKLVERTAPKQSPRQRFRRASRT